MKINIQDQNGSQILGWKYWVIIGVLSGGIASIGGENPELTPYNLIKPFFTTECTDQFGGVREG